MGRFFTPDGLAWYSQQVPQPNLPFRSDISNAQVASLGLMAATYCGVEIPKRAWEGIDRGWRQLQRADGAWPYSSMAGFNELPAPGLTAAGLATLFVTQEMLARDATERGNITDANMEKARSWVTQNFDAVIRNDWGAGPREIYALYALERCGVAGGYRYFGKRDWYRAGIDFLKSKQHADGSWRGHVFSNEDDGVADTAFAMLFLSYGRAPIAVTKLEYDSHDANGQGVSLRWHQRPRDIANLTRWMGLNLERHLNWQILPLSASLDDLLDSPVLYMSGDRAFTFTDEQVAVIRAYIERGGLLLGNADAGSAAFTKSFRQLSSALFPTYESRVLLEDHPILSNSQYASATWKRAPRIEGTSNGVRELIVLVPNDDLARWTHNRAWTQRVDAFQALANIILYTVDKNQFRPRLIPAAAPGQKVAPQQPLIQVARIKYSGNWDPEPKAWSEFAKSAEGSAVNVKTEVVELSQGKLDATKYTLAHLTGTSAFELSADEQKVLGDYLRAGGTLLVDAAGGSPSFMDSATGMLLGLKLSDRGPEAVADTAALFNEPIKVERMSMRPYLFKLKGAERQQVRVMHINDRPAVYLSDTDLTAGLLGLRHDGIAGFSSEVGRSLVRNLLETVSK
jgi:hypothetical protein